MLELTLSSGVCPSCLVGCHAWPWMALSPSGAALYVWVGGGEREKVGNGLGVGGQRPSEHLERGKGCLKGQLQPGYYSCMLMH